jgi:protein TonB
MFEDATFESMGTIHTRSRNWMLATFGLNGSILALLIAIPLIYPSALQRMTYINPLEAPAPVEEQKPIPQRAPAAASPTEMPRGVLQAPSFIPTKPWIPGKGEDPDVAPISLDGGGPGLGSADNPFSGRGVQPVLRPVLQPKPHISSGVMEGMLIYRVLPVYPMMARATHTAGRVELQATISRTGTIENLRVVSGSQLLIQAAIDAVTQWRYRPYLLNGDPVEVETTINVDFRLD